LQNYLLDRMNQGHVSSTIRKPSSKYLEHESFYQQKTMKEVNVRVLEISPTLKFIHPLGQIYRAVVNPKESLSKDMIVTIEEIKSPKTEFLARVTKVRSDLTWSSLCREYFPYYIGQGKSSKALCRCCGYQFTKSEYRIRTTLLRKMASGSIRPCPINICMNRQCTQMQSVGKLDRNNPYQNWQLEPFDGNVYVPSTVTQELPDIHGVNWIHERKSK